MTRQAFDGIVESIRAVHLVRAGAVEARTACINEMKALVITAPAELCEQLPARICRDDVRRDFGDG